MRILSPSLSVIESNLFDPSLGLIRRWIDADPTLSAADLAALQADEVACALRRDMETAQVTEDQQVPFGPVAMPPRIAALVQRRVATLALHQSLRPRPGLILRVDAAIGPEGPLGWDMAQPFVVLLSEATEHRDIWYGWLMSAETDYASPWDLLLEAVDEPYDPLAAMVQTWNPVHLYVPSASAVLGQLSPERLAAVRDLANDIASEQPYSSEADPGLLARRTTSGGHLILTGSPMGYDDDPRSQYQRLYYDAAGLLRDLAHHARQVMSAPARQPWWAGVLAGLKSAAAAAGIPVIPVPVAALGDEASALEAPQAHRLGDLVELCLIPSPTGDAVQIHVKLLREPPLVVGLAQGERVRQEDRLTPETPEADLFAGADQALTFFIRDESDRLLLSLELGDVSA